MTKHRFSASQVETYELCGRKWAWRKIDGIEFDIASPAAELGKLVHHQLELWLREKQPLNLMSDAGQVALAGVHLLPLPGTEGLEIETPFGLEIWGHTFLGYKDWQILNRYVDARLVPIVGDHKTTKDFRWAKTESDLVQNIQACIYAADAMVKTNAEECDLQWTYFKTGGARASSVVHLRVTRDDIAPTLERIKTLCDQMQLIVDSGCTAKDIPINPDACEAFGGCEYAQHCNLTPEEKVRAIMNQQKTSDFLAKLQGRGINPPAAIPTPAAPGAPHLQLVQPPPQQPPQQPPMQPPPMPQQMQQPMQPPQPVWNPATGQYELPQQPQMQQPPPMPPQQPQMQPPQPVWNPATGQYELPQQPQMQQPPPMPPQQPPPMPPQQPQMQQPPTTEEAPKKKRGRPKKTETPATAAPNGQMTLPTTTTTEQPQLPPQQPQLPPQQPQASQAATDVDEDDAKEALRTQMATLLNQAASLIRTAAEMVKSL